MEAEVNSVVLPESKSFWLRFKSRIKPKSKKCSSNPSPPLNYAVEISTTDLISGKSDSSLRIVSISRDGGLIPVILSHVGKAPSNERQRAKKKKQLGFDAVKIKVKSHDAEISVKSRESEVCPEELTPKRISEEEEEVPVRKSGRRSWPRIAKAFRFSRVRMAKAFQTSQDGPKVSHDSQRRGHAKDTEMAVIEQPKGHEIWQENEVVGSIPRPVNYPAKFSLTSAEVDSKSLKLLKSTDCSRGSTSRASMPNSTFKGREIESAPLSSSSSYPDLPCPDMNNSTTNSQPQKLNMSAKRKGIIAANSTGEGEGYDLAINLSVVIIIMGCLAVFSDRLLAGVFTSLWWYLLPSLLGKYSMSIAADVKMKRLVDPKQWRRRSVSDVNTDLHRGVFRKKGLLQINENEEDR